MNGPPLHQAAARLLAKAAYDEPFTLQRLTGGANNRVYRVTVAARRLALKAYFRHPGDSRDRLAAEFAFVRYASSRGLRAVPEPLACDLAGGLALYEYIDGRRLDADQVDRAAVADAAEFIAALNRDRQSPAAARLPPGAEACFSIRSHLECVQRRIERLRRIERHDDVDRDAAEFVALQLAQTFQRVAGNLVSRAAADELLLDAPLPPDHRVISPSDFGFHNTLATDTGLRFIDFEYAGWDDPAKLVCDFFCQPALPVPPSLYDAFSLPIAELLPRPDWHARRFALLLPVYRLKWCCIMLNEFLPIDRRRRLYAAQPANPTQRKRIQLAKARRALENLAA